MILTGYLLSSLIAVGIVFIGSRFLWTHRRTDSAHIGRPKQKSLEIYQHLSLQSVEKAYQEADPERSDLEHISVGLYVPLLG